MDFVTDCFYCLFWLQWVSFKAVVQAIHDEKNHLFLLTSDDQPFQCTNTVGPKSEGDLFDILNSKCCRAASWYLRRICASGLATDSSGAWGASTNRYRKITMALQTLRLVLACESTRWSVNQTCSCLQHSGISYLDMKLEKNQWVTMRRKTRCFFCDWKQQLPLITKCLVDKVSCCPKNLPSHVMLQWERSHPQTMVQFSNAAIACHHPHLVPRCYSGGWNFVRR